MPLRCGGRVRDRRLTTVSESVPAKVMMRLPRKAFAITVVICLSWAGLAISLTSPKILGLYHDDALYVISSKSLAEGKGYRIISLPEEPLQTKYPILFPLLLAPVWLIQPSFPENIPYFQSIIICCGVAFLYLSQLFFLNVLKLNLSASTIVLSLLATSPILLSVSQWVLTELPYGTLTLFTLIYFESCYQKNRSASVRQIATLALFSASAYLIKSHGAVLALAITGLLLLRRKLRDSLIFSLVTLTLVLPWFAWVAANAQPNLAPLTQHYTSYHDSFSKVQNWEELRQLGWMSLHNLRYLTWSVDYFFLPLLNVNKRGSYFLVSFIGLVGLWLISIRCSLLVGFYMIALIAVILLLPWHPLRHLIPAMPLLYGACGVSIFTLYRRLREQPGDSRLKWAGREALKLTSALGLVLVFLGNAVLVAMAFRDKPLNFAPAHSQFWNRDVSWSGYQETIDWIRANTDDNARLAAIHDVLYYLYSGRKGTLFWFHKPRTYFYPTMESAQPAVGDVKEVVKSLHQSRIQWLVREPAVTGSLFEKNAIDDLAVRIIESGYPKATLAFVSSDGGHLIYKLEW